jgi:flagellar export protein FliJ
MAFKFPLQAVLHYRQSMERQHELRLRYANHQVAKIRHLIDLTDERIHREQTLHVEALAAGVTSAELSFSAAAQNSLRAQRTRMEAELKRLQTLRDQQQRIFQQVRRDRETIDSLREHQLVEYKRDSARRDQRQADDLFLLRQSYLRRG